MGRLLRTVDSDVFGNITTVKLTTTGLLSPQAGTENILGPTIITSSQTLLDSDASYYVVASSSIAIILPATTTEGRIIEIIDGTNFSSQNITIGRNGNTIEGADADLTVNLSASFKCIYYGSDWKIVF
jgi:hypothetical protein